ncbi:MAG TPA: SMC family ATPase [Cellulomonas sp.]
MRLHSLTIQAVGPFAGRHDIGFAELSAGGLFLLEGPTGAGKSTLIDAIVFALYGKVAGAAASEERLRSAFAADGTETVVDLVFETSAGVFRVRRTPAYERAKKSGAGRTRQQAGVTLWRLGGTPDGPADTATGEVLATRLDEAGAELTRIVGLDRTQFVQTMVLPQGEFASFLRADPEQRRGLLQRIFGTEVYERLQQRLEEQRREVNRALADARTRVREAVVRFAEAAGVDQEGAETLRQAADGPTDALVALVEERTAELVATGVEAESVAAGAADRAVVARTASVEAADLLRRVRHRYQVLAERAELVGRAERHATEVERLDLARRAAVVRPVLRGLDEAHAGLAEARLELASVLASAPVGLVPDGLASINAASTGVVPTGVVPPARTGPAGAAGTSDESDPGPAALAEARRTLTDVRGQDAATAATLVRLVTLEEGLARREAEVDLLRASVAGSVAAATEVDAELAGRPAARTKIVDRFERAGTVAATAPARRHELTAAEDIRAAVRDLHATERERAAALAVREQLAAAAVQTVQAEARLRQARLDGFAGELAGGLRPGEECPVCGSTEHPHIAALAPDHVSQEQVVAAEQHRRAAEDRVAAAETDLATLVERSAALARVAAGRDLAAAEAAVASAQDQLTEAVAAEGLRDVSRSALADHDRRTEELQARRDGLAAGRRTIEADLDRAVRDLDRDRQEVERARDGHPTVADRRSGLVSRVEAAEALLGALDRRVRGAEDVAARTAEVAALLVAQQLGSPDEARAASAGPAEVAALERAVEQHRSALARVDLELAADPQLAHAVRALVGGTVPGDVARAAPDEAGSAGGVPDGDRSDQAVPGGAPDPTEPELTVPDPAVLAAVESAVEERTIAERTAQDAVEQEAARLTSARDRAAAATAAARLVSQAGVALGEQEHAAGPVVRMAGLASGSDADNGRALSLPTYVLVRRFEDVVAAANERLRQMSDGRYELERSDEREDVRTRRTGLAMRVLDHTTERARDPRTLSGGETFYVSLCLALGMADVVTAEAGGIELGTLFVDEGFGSLDPETLDVVLAELGRLRAGGRVVGVVSHVEAMKSAVAERIEVRRRPDGSSTLTVVAG